MSLTGAIGLRLRPSNLTGANTGSLLAHFGTPRTVLADVSFDF